MSTEFKKRKYVFNMKKGNHEEREIKQAKGIKYK